MATPAAILGILVKASTTQANLALAKTDAQLNATAASAERTTAATTTAGASMRKMGTMAKLAGGALAIGFVIEAKKAVETTQELTKSTIGLHKNLGIATKKSSEWAAVARARGVDSTKLGMAFKTLSTQTEAARNGSDSAMKSFKALGITQRELAAGSKDVNGLILEVADGMDKLGSGTERTAISSSLFGRGWQTIVPLMRDGSAELKKNLDLTKEYGATLSGDTFKAQEQLLANTRESKIAWMGLQVSLSSFVTPVLNDLNEQFQRISKTLADPKLTQDEKFSKVAGIIQKDFEVAINTILDMLPEIASGVGQQAPKVAEAFITGFLDTDAWGKLAIGAFLISKMGGLSALKAAGTKMGGTFAAAWALAAGVGIEEGFTQPGGIIDTIQGHATDTSIFSEIVGKEVEKLKKQYGSLAKAGAILTDSDRQETIKRIQLARDEGQISKWHASVLIADLRGIGDQYRKLGDIGKQVTDGLVKQSQRAQDAMGALVGTTAKGMTAVAKLTNNVLSALGVNKVDFNISGIGTAAALGAAKGKQRGGMIGGSGTGDKVHVMAEPGEGFINKTAVSAMGGPSVINAINSAAPRFQGGGMVGMQPGITSLINNIVGRFGGFLSSGYRPGDTGSFHGRGLAGDWVGGDWAGASRYVNSIGPKLLEGIYNPAVHGGSAVSWDSGSRVSSGFWGADWGAHQDHIHMAIGQMLSGAMGPGAEKVARIMLQGPAGALRSTGQGALDKVHAAANRYIGRHTPTSTMDLAGATVATGPIQQMARQMVSQMWGAGQWTPFNLLEMQEAGWNPRAQNPSSGAAGLAQALPPSKYPPGAWPYTGLDSAKLQLEWMMGYIRDRYGTPAGAWAHEQSVGWYGNGGTVPGPIGRPQRAIVHGGEHISPAGTPHVEVNLYGDASALLEDVEVLIDGKVPDIAEYTLREGGRNRARSRQLAGQAGRA